MWIGITGPAFYGKDTIADHLCFSHDFSSEALSEPLRDGLKAMFGLQDWHFSREHKEKVIEWIGKSPRELMQTLGTEWGRTLVHRQIWCKCLKRRIQEYPACVKDFVIPDVRFEDEVRFIRENGGVIWRVIRPGAVTTSHSGHDSEQNHQAIIADLDILNDGTIDDLHRTIDSVCPILPIGNVW